MGDKPKNSEVKNEDIRKPHKILQEMNIVECSIAMRVICFMIDCPGNMRAEYKGREVCLKCKLKVRESQGHLEVCHGYREYRVGRDLANFRDKVAYFSDLIKERENMLTNICKAKEKKLRRKS